jgi:hypothetical protein
MIMAQLSTVSLVAESPDPELIELLIDDDTPLGLQIRSSHHHPGVFIHNLVPGSLSEQCGQLLPGDRLLEANGHDLKFVTVDDAASIISVSLYGCHLVF